MQQFQLPVVEVAGITFNMMTLISIDRAEYLANPTKPDRVIVLQLAGEVEHEFVGERADIFNKWYCVQFGQTSPLHAV
jgi:hypothetical protein